jgi:hypothetical protein
LGLFGGVDRVDRGRIDLLDLPDAALSGDNQEQEEEEVEENG